MTDRPVIALDVMGGDAGPATVIAAAEIAHERYPRLRYRLFGDEAIIAPLLAKAKRVAANAIVVHSPDVILGTDKPSVAVRRARTTSMGMGIAAVKAGEAAAMVSAGNTGALMAMAKLERCAPCPESTGRRSPRCCRR